MVSAGYLQGYLPVGALGGRRPRAVPRSGLPAGMAWTVVWRVSRWVGLILRFVREVRVVCVPAPTGVFKPV